MNAISGLITVLVGVYASHGGEWSATAKVTISIVALSFYYMLITSFLYQY
jgi:hypothetical protein